MTSKIASFIYQELLWLTICEVKQQDIFHVDQWVQFPQLPVNKEWEIKEQARKQVSTINRMNNSIKPQSSEMNKLKQEILRIRKLLFRSDIRCWIYTSKGVGEALYSTQIMAKNKNENNTVIKCSEMAEQGRWKQAFHNSLDLLQQEPWKGHRMLPQTKIYIVVCFASRYQRAQDFQTMSIFIVYKNYDNQNIQVIWKQHIV